MLNDNQSTNIFILEKTQEPLTKRFNKAVGKIRFIALLSPTCPLGRDKGARAVHENVFEKFPNANISASIIWIPILDNDTFESAIPSVKFLNDNRIQHFYDNDKVIGKSIANSLGWVGHTAWDIYLFYPTQAQWIDVPPKPVYWMHQLTDAWATMETYRTGDDLKNELSISMENLINFG